MKTSNYIKTKLPHLSGDELVSFVLTNPVWERPFKVCTSYLVSVCTLKSYKNSYGSYGLKGDVERAFGLYIPEIAMVASVIHAGVPYKMDKDYEPIEHTDECTYSKIRIPISNKEGDKLTDMYHNRMSNL